MAQQRLTKLERNAKNNASQIETVVKVFRKTDNIERLVELLSCFLDSGEFRMLFATEFANIPLKVEFVDENGKELVDNNA